MAPRTRQAGHLASAAALCIDQLPSELLSLCLGILEDADRHRAALVSRHWHRCALVPELCRSVTLKRGSEAGFTSLAAFLARHGQHVRSLCLTSTLESAEARPYADAAAAAQYACLAACTACTQLQELLVLWPPWAELDLPPLPSSLSRLTLYAAWANTGNSLASLTQLTWLDLASEMLEVTSANALPASLEFLRCEVFHGLVVTGNERVLESLTHLSTLVVDDSFYGASAHSALTCLQGLRQLQLHGNCHLPPCLGQLSQLEALVLWDAGQEDLPEVAEEEDEGPQAEAATEALNDALWQLTRLTSLCVHNVPACTRLPALEGLHHLQRLCLSGCLEEQGSLPPGLWCSRLRELGASVACLNRSIAMLEDARQLRRLAVLGRSVLPSPDFLHWAAVHPPLHELEFFIQHGALLVDHLERSAMQQAALQLLNRRPQLHVTQQIPCPVETVFSRSFLLDQEWPVLE